MRNGNYFDGLLAAYPDIGGAMAYVEVIVDDELDPENGWTILMSERGDPGKVVDRIRETYVDLDLRPFESARIRAEMDRPNFLRYIAGRMGAV